MDPWDEIDRLRLEKRALNDRINELLPTAGPRPKRAPGPKPKPPKIRHGIESALIACNGNTVAAGRLLGISGQRVRQVAPSWLRNLLRQRESARRRLRNFERYHSVCRVCGRDFLGTAICSAECREVWMHLRFHVDSTQWESHRKAVAKGVLRREGRPTNNAWAEAVLTDPPDPPPSPTAATSTPPVMPSRSPVSPIGTIGRSSTRCRNQCARRCWPPNPPLTRNRCQSRITPVRIGLRALRRPCSSSGGGPSW